MKPNPVTCANPWRLQYITGAFAGTQACAWRVPGVCQCMLELCEAQKHFTTVNPLCFKVAPMCFRVLLATACFALAAHAQEASGSCPILCVNGECKPISSPGHEGHYICECTPPFRGDSCSVQSAAATSSPQPSASRTPQPSVRSTPQPTAVGNNLSTMQTSSPYTWYNAAAHLLRS